MWQKVPQSYLTIRSFLAAALLKCREVEIKTWKVVMLELLLLKNTSENQIWFSSSLTQQLSSSVLPEQALLLS